MCEHEKSLQELDAKRIIFNSHINTLEFEHPKLYKKLMPIFDEISQWMIGAQDYMKDLKISVDKNHNHIYETEAKLIQQNINMSLEKDKQELDLDNKIMKIIYEIQNKPIYPTWHQESK